MEKPTLWCLKGAGAAVLLGMLAACGGQPEAEHAADTAQVDCPLRDAPYSVDLPLMDLMQNEAAKQLVEEHSPQLLNALPKHLTASEPPSFSAIMTLRTLLAMGGQNSSLEAIDQKLRALPVTVHDKVKRCARYDVVAPDIDVPAGKPRILVFEKINGYRDGPSVDAARELLQRLAIENDWAMAWSDNGAVMNAQQLKHFDVVVWNNISGDVLTLSQRSAFRDYIEDGGAYVGIHGSGGDPIYFWDWYADELIGARFIGHTNNPQYHTARLVREADGASVWSALPREWLMSDEWYAFDRSPRKKGAKVVLSLDESSYSPKGMFGRDISMGDHPIAWSRCVGKGRSFYSAIGHRPETYRHPHHIALLKGAINWAAGADGNQCKPR